MASKQSVFERLYSTPTVASTMRHKQSTPSEPPPFKTNRSPLKAADFTRLYKQQTQASKSKVTTPRSKMSQPVTPPTFKSMTPTPTRRPRGNYAAPTVSSKSAFSTPPRLSTPAKSTKMDVRTPPPRKARTPRKSPVSASKKAPSSCPSKPKKTVATKARTPATSTATSVPVSDKKEESAVIAAPSHSESALLFTKMAASTPAAEGEPTAFLSMEQVEQAMDELYPHLPHKSLALLAFQTADSTGADSMGRLSADDFEYCLHFVVYFHNLWERLELNDMDTVSKADFLHVAANLGLFPNVTEAFAALDSGNTGSVGFDEFCAACAKRKLQLAAQEQDKKTNSKEGNSKEGSGGLKEGVREIMAVLDALELPTRKTAQGIFQRLNTNNSNAISLIQIEKEMLESNPELKRKVEAYKVHCRDGESTDDMTTDDLHRFLLFLVYYRNLWEEFVFIDDDDLQVSKGEFIPVAESLHLFDDVEVEFSNMDVAGNGHILFEDFCSLCAKKQMAVFGRDD